jgi:hypothetical protein
MDGDGDVTAQPDNKEKPIQSIKKMAGKNRSSDAAPDTEAESVGDATEPGGVSSTEASLPPDEDTVEREPPQRAAVSENVPARPEPRRPILLLRFDRRAGKRRR